MNEKKTMELLHQVVTLSKETEYCMAAHDVFCQHGQEWLLEHDPTCDKEAALIQSAKQAFCNDFQRAVKNLPKAIQDDLMDEFSDLDDMDYWWELREAVGLNSGDSK